MDQDAPPGLRILIGASSFADASAALRIVERLPDVFRITLGGLLVEDPDTLAVCQIPDRRVILQSGVTIVAPSPSQVRNLLKADARAFQASLTRTAPPDSADWVFTQDEGDLVPTSLRAARGWDVLVIGHRQVHRMPGRIVILQTGEKTSDEIRLVTDSLSRQFSADPITISIGGESPGGAPSPASSYDTLDAGLRALTRINALAVLVDLQHGPVHDPAGLVRVLEAARCPVVVFNASGGDALLEHSIQVPPQGTRPPDDR